MASVERTAYPRFVRSDSPADLKATFSVSEDEIEWLRTKTPTARHRLGLAEIPAEVVSHIRETLGYSPRIQVDYSGKNTLHRHMAAVRSSLGVTAFYGKAAFKVAEEFAKNAAEILDQRADIINALATHQRWRWPRRCRPSCWAPHSW
ncbi:DUF4158 domain-containing protein [Dechloromonas sp. A34]|uniref:DUF4158 domain-containing protein n=1 Tax=Dechloromonas sp. A34 TaxID=447588 RepID=UPI002248F22F|nr:DUF4158 domain-containing protein [Dechloromonas sp. A34]